MWNADSRIFLTASIVDRAQLNIDPFAAQTGDVARSNGHSYSDKAPGLSLLAAPVYALLKYTLLGGRPYAELFAVPPDQRVDFLPRYLLAVVFGGVPTGLLCALLYAFLARLGVARRWRTLLALTYGLGTIALPFASVFFGHQLGAALLFGAFVLLFRVRHNELGLRYAVLAGLLAGYAVITEYPTAIIAAALLLYALGRPRAGWRPALLMAAGAVPALAVAAGYNALAFGSPLSAGYAHLAGPAAFRIGQAQGLLGITYPHLDALWQTTFGPYRGLFLLSPVLLLALPGFALLARRLAWRVEATLCIGIVVAYFAFTVSYFEWSGGFSLGPRHFLPALPFLVLPIGELLRPVRSLVWRRATVALAAVSIAIVGLATATGPLLDPRFDSPLTEWVLPALVGLTPNPAQPAPTAGAVAAAFSHGGVLLTQARLDNNWGMVLGLPGALQLLPLAAAISLTLAWRLWRARLAGMPDAASSWEPEPAVAVVAQAPSGGPRTASNAAEPGASLAEAASRRPEVVTGGPVAVSSGGGTIPVRQAPGALVTSPPQTRPAGRVAIKPPGVTVPWENTILEAARQRGDEPPLRVRQALTAVKLALSQSQSLSFFRRVRSILLYGPLAQGDDPFREVNLLIVCNPLKAIPIEQAFAELDRFVTNVRAETGVELRCLLVVRGQPERVVPGEPSWRELAQRGVIVYGEPID
jgi:hypothetical protein